MIFYHGRMNSVLRYVLIILLLPTTLLAGTRIYLVHAPPEIASGDDFTLVVSAAPREKGNNRCIVVQLPHSCKIIKAYAVSESKIIKEGLEENTEVSAMFTPEKNHTVTAFKDIDVIEKETGSVIYYIVIRPPSQTTTAEIKCCLVERSDPYYTTPPPAPKEKKPKKVKPRNYEWRMMNPAKGAELSFGNGFSPARTRSVRIISGWTTSSRALEIKPKATVEFMPSGKDLMAFFRKPFSISWWMRSVETEQSVFSLGSFNAHSDIRIGINEMGQPFAAHMNPDSEETFFLQADNIASDGAWHHHVLSRDSFGILRYFFDGVVADSSVSGADVFDNIISLHLGGGANDDYQLDELRLIRTGYINANEYVSSVAVAERDTAVSLFALFHFDNYGSQAYSSVSLPIEAQDSIGPKIASVAMLQLDSMVQIHETSSPVLLDAAPLSAEQTSSMRIAFSWKATREQDLKSYILQRRIASFGEYHNVLRVSAKRPIISADDEPTFISRAMYSAVETLPPVGNDIDLYYRLALISKDSSLRFTDAIKIEYGKEKDIFVEQNKPNPFNPTTTISFRMARSGLVKLTVYDIIGREVLVLIDKKLAQGRHSIDIDASRWPAGIYFYKVRMGKTVITKRMVLAK